MQLLSLIKNEKQKNKGRFNSTFVFLCLLIELLFIRNGLQNPTNLAQGWFSVYQELPIMNALFLPTIFSVTSSRIFDLEHREETWKLLYTMETPQSILLAKVIYGLRIVFLVSSLQTVLTLAGGLFFHFGGTFKPHLLVLQFINTTLITTVIYLLCCIIAYINHTQIISISIGILGSFCGLFSFYFKQGLLQMIIPWGLYAPTTFSDYKYYNETSTYVYYYKPVDSTIYIAILLWILLLSFILYYVSQTPHVEGFELPFAYKTRISNKKFSILPPELLKVKHSFIWLPFLVIPIVASLFGNLNYTANTSVLREGWYDLWTQHSLFLGFIFLPALLALLNGYFVKLEHSGTNWNMIRTLNSPYKIVWKKFCASALISLVALLWIIIIYIFSGYVLGIDGSVPIELIDWALSGYLGALACISIHLFFSLLVKNYAVQIGFGVLGGLFGLFTFSVQNLYSNPFSLLALGLRVSGPRFKINHIIFCSVSIGYIILFLGLSVLYLYLSDTKANEG